MSKETLKIGSYWYIPESKYTVVVTHIYPDNMVQYRYLGTDTLYWCSTATFVERFKWQKVSEV